MALIGPLVALEAIVSATGLVHPAVYEGLVPAHYVAESRGQDAVSLVLGIPALLVGLAGVRRGRLASAVLTIGALLYIAYVSVIYAYGGVANVLYFAYVACLGLACFATWRVGSLVDLETVGALFLRPPLTKSVAVFLWLESLLLLLVWGGLGAAAIAAGAPSEANTILVTDLAFVIPGFILAGVWLWQRRPHGVVLAGSALVLNVILNASIAAGQLMRLFHGIEPAWPLAGMFGFLGAASLALAIWFFRSFEERDDYG
ncbi:MAG: hypothetical protein KC731_00065 [Myxococcales bacterium]|nr:hypothetical protein [Myxococcales bacterium]